MKPGRSLDALVAEKVMGREYDSLSLRLSLETGLEYGVPHYSTSIADAWEVVEKLGLHELGMAVDAEGNRTWKAVIRASAYAEADTAPHAICLAALKAVGAQV